MRNASAGFWWCSPVATVLQQVLGPEASPHGFGLQLLMQRVVVVAVSPFTGGGMTGGGHGVPSPLLFRALSSLNLLLLVGYLLLVLLAKLFARLHLRATTATDRTSNSSWYHGCDDHYYAEEATDTDDVAAADIVGGQRPDTMFWFDEAVFEDSALLLGDEGKDHHLYTATPDADAACCLQQVVSTFPMEEDSAARISPRNQEVQNHHRADTTDAAETKQQVVVQEAETNGIAAVDVSTVPEQRNEAPFVTSPGKNVSIQGNLRDTNSIDLILHSELYSFVRSSHLTPILFVPGYLLAVKKETSRDEGGEQVGRDAGDRDDEHTAEEEEDEKSVSEGHPDVKLFVNSRAVVDTRKLLLEGVAAAGAGGEAKLRRKEEDSKDRNGDSSGRFGASTLASESTSKSSVEWRSSTVTKDSETEYPFSSSSRRSSARSIKYQPRSMSERIVHKLTPKPSAPIGLRDPYPDLERAYVAQVCLPWEALNWNYTSFRRHNGGDGNIAARCCPARVAQEFQQFQVLLHRFIENEPYEYGRRPEVYARMKNSTPKLLLVPEFRDEDDEKDDLTSAVQFLLILEESIRTFMTFLRADKRSHYEMFREMVKRRSSAADQTLVITLKKTNKRKKSRLKDLTRPRRCLKRTRLREEEELSILLGLIDLKVVARVLRMAEVTDQQLHWCEEKMNRVRVDVEGKMQRDPSPLFYPAH
nr:unnamed protein product [Digitaria exilis]